jgi:hypothetical protein
MVCITMSNLFNNPLLKSYAILLTYVLFLLLLPALITEVNYFLKVILCVCFVFSKSKASDAINNLVAVIHIKRRINDTNDTIEMLCLTAVYGMGYFFIKAF